MARCELPGQPSRLRWCETELRPSENLEMLMEAVTGEGRRRIATADEDDPPTVRDLGDGLRHDVVESGIARHVLVVVEDDGERRSQSAVKLAEEAPSEHGDVLAVLGRQQRKRPPATWRGQAEVVEERGDVGVAFVELVPEPAGLARRDVARDQGRLPRAWRRPYPRDRFLPGEIEPLNQPRPHQDLRLRGTGGLRQRHDNAPARDEAIVCRDRVLPIYGDRGALWGPTRGGLAQNRGWFGRRECRRISGTSVRNQ